MISGLGSFAVLVAGPASYNITSRNRLVYQGPPADLQESSNMADLEPIVRSIGWMNVCKPLKLFMNRGRRPGAI